MQNTEFTMPTHTQIDRILREAEAARAQEVSRWFKALFAWLGRPHEVTGGPIGQRAV